MRELDEMLKDLLLVMWCLYVTVMTIKGLFQAEEVLDIWVGITVWAFMIIIPVGIRGQ